jgi:hypothetical protein
LPFHQPQLLLKLKTMALELDGGPLAARRECREAAEMQSGVCAASAALNLYR